MFHQRGADGRLMQTAVEVEDFSVSIRECLLPEKLPPLALRSQLRGDEGTVEQQQKVVETNVCVNQCHDACKRRIAFHA